MEIGELMEFDTSRVPGLSATRRSMAGLDDPGNKCACGAAGEVGYVPIYPRNSPAV